MIGEVTAKVVEVAAKVGGETTKEAGKIAAKGVDKGIDISKRIDPSKKPLDIKTTSVDITKRFVPVGMDLIDGPRELTPKQVKELLSNGMSPGIIKDLRFEEGIYKLKTVNESLAEKNHPEVGVKYEKKIIDLFGKKVEGVFPKFDSVFTAKLPMDKLMASDSVQFKICNEQLKNAVEKNSSLKNSFSAKQLDQISNGYKPSGFTWHHNEKTGIMELVDTTKHEIADHTGGRALWGGGGAAR